MKKELAVSFQCFAFIMGVLEFLAEFKNSIVVCFSDAWEKIKTYKNKKKCSKMKKYC